MSFGQGNATDSKQLLFCVDEAVESEFYSHDSSTNEENIVFEEFEPT